MVKLKKIKVLKKCASLVLALILTVLTLAPVSSAVTYPAGVTAEQAQTAMTKTDTVITSLLSATEGKSLYELITPLIFSDATLSSLMKAMYSMGEENAETFSTIGLAMSPSDIAKNLGNYPDVQAKLNAASSWSALDLTNAVWGVTNLQQFTDAAVAVFLPMNELLYTMLCGGSYSLNPLVGIKGSKGYEKSILQIFVKFGMQSYTAPGDFYAQAAADKTTMIRNLIKDVAAYLELVCSAPATMLSTKLPGIAHFIENGGLDNAVASLVEPLKIKVLGITTPIKIGSVMESAQQGEGGMSFDINLDLGSFSATGTLVTAPFDMQEIASFVSEDIDTYTVNSSDCFIYVMRWLLETLKLNMGSIPQMLSGAIEGMDATKISQLLTGLFSKTTDEIISVYVGLMTAQSGKVNPYVWSFNPVTTAQITYTQNLGRDKYLRVLNGIDELINDFVKEGGEAESLREVVAPEIYSGAVVTKLVCGIYSLLSDEKIKPLLSMAGLEISPAALAATLGEQQYAQVRQVLVGASDYFGLEELELDWGFKNGDRDAFIRTVSAVFRPLENLLRMVLCGDSLNVLGGVPFYGSDGYNTAVIPILEAIGCGYDEIRSFDEFNAQVRQTDVMFPIVQTLVSFIERVIDYPVYTVTGILPNLMYFINNGGIEICINNLLYPITSVLDSLGLAGQLDFSAMMQIDTDAIMDELVAGLDLGIKLPELDLQQFASMGVAVSAQTKRTQATQPMTIQYVQPDRTGVLITLLRYMVEIMKTPGNEGIVDSFLASNGDNEMFANYSSGIEGELAAMSVDETIEWLYKIFFRERATVEDNKAEDYTPTIIYEEKNKINWGAFFGATAAVLVAAAIVAFINRKKLLELIEQLRERKAEEE